MFRVTNVALLAKKILAINKSARPILRSFETARKRSNSSAAF